MADIKDAGDYVGGAGVSGRVICIDAGGRVTQTPAILTNQNGVGFFSTSMVGQQAVLATMSAALTSANAADSTVVALALNSLGLTINSVNLYLQRFGLQASA